jgi:DNA-binding beta-propeller fold protein YncE
MHLFKKLIFFLCFCTPVFLLAQSKKITLPNSWTLQPAGRSMPLGDLPLNIAVSNSKKLIAVTNNGQSVQSIQLINPATEKILDNIVVAKCWYGLKFSTDEKFLYASGGNDNWILKYGIENNKLISKDTIILGKKGYPNISPAGIEINDALKTMYVVTKENNSLYTIDLTTKKIVQVLKLEEAGYSCLLSKNKKELYISVWGAKKVAIYDIASQKISTEINVGENPNELLLSKNGKYLFVFKKRHQFGIYTIII